jgi:hypothetical protein
MPSTLDTHPSSEDQKSRRSKPSMHRPNQLRRNSSKGKLLAMVALGQLGRSDSFALQPTVSSTKSLSSLSKSCPDLKCDLSNEVLNSNAVWQSTGRRKKSATALNMLNMDSTFNLADAATGASTLFNHLGADPQVKKKVQDEGMSLLSHALLDLPGMVAKATVAAKAAEVAGRLFILGQDTLPGHGVAPDELAFQLAFLATSCNALYHTVMPKIKAQQACKFMTPQDRKAFRELFKPAGMTWEQYREVSVTSMEWEEFQPGQVLDADQAYWLYQGDILSEEGSVSSGLVGEDHIARTLGIFNGEEIAPKTVVAGPEGAKVLKLNSQKLAHKMKHDAALPNVLNRVVYNNMQSKIELAMSQKQPTTA